MNSFKRFGIERQEIVLLDTVETRDIWELIRKCDALNLKYKPGTWYGDPDNATAQRFIQEMDREALGTGLSCGIQSVVLKSSRFVAIVMMSSR